MLTEGIQMPKVVRFPEVSFRTFFLVFLASILLTLEARTTRSKNNFYPSMYPLSSLHLMLINSLDLRPHGSQAHIKFFIASVNLLYIMQYTLSLGNNGSNHQSGSMTQIFDREFPTG